MLLRCCNVVPPFLHTKLPHLPICISFWLKTNEQALVTIISDLHGIIMCQTKQSLMLSNTFQDLKCLCNLLCSFEFVRSEINTFTLTGARSWSIVHYVHWIRRSNIYRKVASSSMSRLVAHLMIFRRLMKGKFDTYVVWPLAKKFQNWIVDRSTARDFTVS